MNWNVMGYWTWMVLLVVCFGALVAAAVDAIAYTPGYEDGYKDATIASDGSIEHLLRDSVDCWKRAGECEGKLDACASELFEKRSAQTHAAGDGTPGGGYSAYGSCTSHSCDIMLNGAVYPGDVNVKVDCRDGTGCVYFIGVPG